MIVRAPAILTYEYPKEMLDDITGQLKKEFSYGGTEHVYKERWKFMAEAFQELENQTLDAQVEWGAEFQDTIIPLRICRGELMLAIQDLLRAMKEPYEHRVVPRQQKAEERSILYYIGEKSENDKFTSEINAAIQQFESKLRPHIRK
jgi:hypothetical protein